MTTTRMKGILAVAGCAFLVSGATADAAGHRSSAAVPGVGAHTIQIANVSTITGAVPGLFLGSQLGTTAYVDYVNSTGGVFGKKLQLTALDDQFSCTQEQAAIQSQIGRVFAFVGQTSIVDSCGAAILSQHPEIPDVSYTFDATTGNMPNFFSAAPYQDAVVTTPLVLFKQKFPTSIQKVGILQTNSATVIHQIDLQVGAMKSLGYNVVYRQSVPITLTPANVTPYVVSMQEAGIQFVSLTSMGDSSVAAFLNAAQQQGFKPQVVWNTGTAYDSTFAATVAPGAADNLIISENLAPFRDPKSTSEGVRLFRKWLNVAKPGFSPDVWSAYSWSSTALFVQALKKAGPHFTQASVLAALKTIHKFDADGLVGTTDPADRYRAICNEFLGFQNGKFKRIYPPKHGLFTCDGRIWKAP